MEKEKAARRECPVETAMLLIGNKWKIFVLRELLGDTRRFSELQRAITGISQKVLTQNLRAMEKDGLIARKVFAEVPPRVEYTLSDLGRTLKPVIMALMRWGMQYQELFDQAE
jgi:DNA-binding HxlR family transcriptional regulator